jgi:alkaline phosphatase
MVRRSIELLQFNRGGYLLIVDAGSMRPPAERNEGERTLLETIELDRAVAVALEYAGTKSTIFVCGDVAVGGMNVNGFLPRTNAGAGSPAPLTPADLRFTWATGPNGPGESGSADASASGPAPPAAIEAQPRQNSQPPSEARGSASASATRSADNEALPPGDSATTSANVENPEPAAIYAASAQNTAADVIAFATGPGADALHGVLESTAIFEIIQDNL